MKLVNLYLIGVFAMIAFLVGSTMWQFNQFQGNIKNLQFNMPQEITQSMPNANQQIAEMMAQMQTQMQGGATPSATEESATAETKTWTAPDESFSFDYPADWIAMPLGQPVESATGKILFSAYKTGDATSSINSLSVEETNFGTAQDLMKKIETDARAKNIPAKITRAEIIKGAQTIPVIETEYSIAEPVLEVSINFKTSHAILITAPQKTYTLSAILQNPETKILQEIEAIIKSVSFKPGI